jgi:hypothetical protein
MKWVTRANVKDLTPESPGLEALAEGFKRLAAAEAYDDLWDS